jgi:two-component system LytT family sensor kinase
MHIKPGYWTFQSIGWGGILIATLFFTHSLGQLDKERWIQILFSLSMGVTLSHLMRLLIRRTRLLDEPLLRQGFGFVFMTVLFACLASMVETLFFYFAGFGNPLEKHVDFAVLNLSLAMNAFIVFFLWNTCYFLYHNVSKYRKQEMDTLRLSSTVKELELKSIKSYINPHFIFNALNSIRALVDEDPSRARNAVTALGNILRSSLQTEQQETVTLQKELGIVKDYLALQHIRFEDRLRVEYDIDPSTLNLPVPIMMLQMLVENAVKHGIGRRVNGGIVRIVSKRKGDRFELVVQNTGHLNRNLRHTGFGLNSTANRLQLLFGDSAHFSITETPERMVEAVVVMPVMPTGMPINTTPVVLRRGAA